MTQPTNAEIAAEMVHGGADMSRAIVYALLAVVDALGELKRPPADEVPQVPYEQTREGWTWDVSNPTEKK